MVDHDLHWTFFVLHSSSVYKQILLCEPLPLPSFSCVFNVCASYEDQAKEYCVSETKTCQKMKIVRDGAVALLRSIKIPKCHYSKVSKLRKYLCHACTPLPRRPSAANSYYNPLAVRAHPPVPASGVLHVVLLPLLKIVSYLSLHRMLSPLYTQKRSFRWVVHPDHLI